VKEIGTAELDGEEVRRYAGEISQEESLAAVPEADRAAVRRALEDLTAGSPAARDLEVPFEAWVDGDGMIRREQLSLDTPAKDGVAAGRSWPGSSTRTSGARWTCACRPRATPTTPPRCSPRSRSGARRQGSSRPPDGYDPVMVLALSDVGATLGLVGVFFVSSPSWCRA
jgi:hypothetical protein